MGDLKISWSKVVMESATFERRNVNYDMIWRERHFHASLRIVLENCNFVLTFFCPRIE